MVPLKNAVIALVCICDVVVGGATRAEPMSLEEALSAAYESNPQLEAARASLRATDEEVAKALAGWRPTLAANGSYGFQRQSQTLLGPQTVDSIPQAEQVTVTQPVFDGRTIPNTERAKALVQAGRAELAATEATVLFNAASAYFNVLRDMEIVRSYQDDIANLQELARNAGNRLRLGELTKTDASQAQARLTGSQLSLASAEQQLATDRASFQHVVGRAAETLTAHAIPDFPDKDKALSIAHSDNPALVESRAQARAADHAVDAAAGALLPTLSIQGQYGRSIDEIAPGVRENGFSVIGQLSIPLYQAGAEEATIRQAKEQSSQAVYASYEAERQVDDDFANAWATFETSNRASELAAVQVSANEAAYEGSVFESRVGSRSVLDILNADQELLQSKIAAVTQLENKAISAYQILRVIGRMNAKDLKLPVKPYDPQEHYDRDATAWFGFGD